MSSVEGRHVLVLGAGRSGAAAAHALLRHGADVTVLESATAGAAVDAAAALDAAGATVCRDTGGVDVAAMELVVLSPGVPEHHAVPVAAAAAGVPVWSEPELAWQLSGGRTTLVAVTGTNGKTTTTELLAACLGAPAAGNIGTPLVTVLDADSPPGLVVAELSSFQLRFCETLHPRVAVLLNVAPDHLDWHGTLRSYRAAKARIWARQGDVDTVVLNADDEGATATATEHPPPGVVVEFTGGAPDANQVGIHGDRIVARIGGDPVDVVAVADLAVHGPHNLSNACAAVAAALSAGGDPATIAGALRSYRPGRHRLETVATIDGITYVDDSKATNPHAAAAALATFPPRTVVWIAGGLGKGLTFESLGDVVAQRVHTAVTIGTSGPEIAEMTRAGGAATVEAQTLRAAVIAAADAARPGDTVLLSPACASMDQFTDYRERGDAFRAAVASLRAQEAPCGQ